MLRFARALGSLTVVMSGQPLLASSGPATFGGESMCAAHAGWMFGILAALTAVIWTYRERRRRSCADQARHTMVSVLEGIEPGILPFDSDFRVEFYNSQLRSLFDLPDDLMRRGASGEALLRRSCTSQQIPEPEVQRILEQLERRESVTIEWPQRDGRIMEVQHRPRPDGSLMLSFTDITARRRAEDELQSQAQLLQTILDSSPVGVSVTTPGGVRKYVNAERALMEGCSREELLRATAERNYVDPSLRERYFAELARTGHVCDAETELLRSDGSTYWVLLSLESIEYEEEAATLAWLYDIDRRKQAEASSQVRESQLRTILDRIPAGVYLANADLELEVFNQKYGVQAAAAALESAARDGDRTAAESALPAPAGELHVVTRAIGETLGAGDDAAPPAVATAVDATRLDADVQQLLSLLDNSDADAIDQFEAMHAGLSQRVGQDACETLRRAIDGFEFDEAADALRRALASAH